MNNIHKHPTLRAEIVAIRNCTNRHQHVDWSHVTLYTTAEPCALCQSAIAQSNISRVVYGTSNQYLQQNHWPVIHVHTHQINRETSHYHGDIRGGVLAEKTNSLFRHQHS